MRVTEQVILRAFHQAVQAEKRVQGTLKAKKRARIFQEQRSAEEELCDAKTHLAGLIVLAAKGSTPEQA
jgi:hypothetical protein